MGLLRVTLIDVGWGDSILLETQDGTERWHYALIDSNDTSTLRSAHIFLKRFFERRAAETDADFDLPSPHPVFDWVLLTHAHADHGQGLKRILQDFGTRRLLYPKSASAAVFFTGLIRYARISSRVVHHQAIDSTKIFTDFGDVAIDILWPPRDLLPPNENNNSVVLALTLENVTFVLTGDAEADVWAQIAKQIPLTTLFFKVPHHGSADAMFDAGGGTPWVSQISNVARLAISSHVRPFSHPHQAVVDLLDAQGETYYRTDQHYHITVETDGQVLSSVRYSHV